MPAVYCTCEMFNGSNNELEIPDSRQGVMKNTYNLVMTDVQCFTTVGLRAMRSAARGMIYVQYITTCLK